MASTTAPAGPVRATAGGGAPPLRQLWQVPTFALGLVAATAACLACPPWQLARKPHEDPALAELRELLKQPEHDPDHALKLGADAVHRASTPATAGEAHFLLGSVYVRLAEHAEASKGPDPWREARGHLERAQALGVSDENRPRLDYRLAKAWAHTAEAPAKVIAALLPSIEAGADDDTDAARGYGLLAEAYLRLPTADLEAALAATVQQIDRAIIDDGVLGPARLRRGELLLRLDRQPEALEVLKNVGPKAPPDVAARARRLRLRILEQTEAWDQAAPLWREVLDDRRSPPPDRGAVLYHLGLCLHRAGARDEALRTWDECLNQGGAGEEGPAAALGVADLRLRDGQFEAALAALGLAVREVKAPGDWHSALVPLPQAREVFETSCKAAAARGEFGAALRVARLYERLAPPGRAQELRADAASAGARAAQEKARLATGDAAKALYGDADDLLRQAGEGYEQAAEAQADPVERAERLWLAANRALEGRDARRAVTAFQRFLEIADQPTVPEARRFAGRLNEAWYKLALAYRDSGDAVNATENFKKAVARLEHSSPYVYRARYELAMTMTKPDGTLTDEAQSYLEQNWTQLRTEIDRDEEAREKTLYALGQLYSDRLKQRDAASRAIEILEEALRAFPNNPRAPTAHYQLAECYRFRADQRGESLSQERLSVDAGLEVAKKVMEDRERAIANYGELTRVLEAKPARDENEEHLLVYSLSAAANVRYWAGGYEKAGEMYQALADRLRDKKGFEFEHLEALGNVARAYLVAATSYASNEPGYEARVRAAQEKARRALGEVRAGLPRLDPEVRKGFEKWLREAFDPPASR
jgi:tetratricopeptide (TPR) repeat protein